MDRSLLIAEPINGIEGRKVLIATSHLESMDSAKIRKEQMKDAYHLLEKTGVEDVIICGDFNFDNSSKQEAEVYENVGYEDVMSRYVDSEAFTMFKTTQFPPWRPDKILHKGAQLKPVNGFICGKFATPTFKEKGEAAALVEKDDLVRTPSDHLSVVADFTFN
jgi:endonuclease/exonuclease/phosphatase family metal-dependent hydrolase